MTRGAGKIGVKRTVFPTHSLGAVPASLSEVAGECQGQRRDDSASVSDPARSDGFSPGPNEGRRPESEQETEAEGPGAVLPARLSRQGTSYIAAASAHPQPHSTPEPLDPEFRAASWVGFAPSITGYAPLRTAQSQLEDGDRTGDGKSDAYLPASPMAASVRTSRGCTRSPTQQLPGTNQGRTRASAAPTGQPIKKRKWSHAQERLPTHQRAM